MFPIGFGGWTMKRRVLWLLQHAIATGERYVTLHDMIEHGGHTFRNRVSELRADGYNITAERDRITGWRYHIEEPGQLSLNFGPPRSRARKSA